MFLLALASLVGSALVAKDRALADASITFQPSPTAATCASSSNLTVTVRDISGNLVPNGTNVTFSTSLGYITTSRATQGGVVDAVLVIPSRLSGTALVTASAVGVTAQRSLNVSCIGASAAAPAPVIAPAPAPRRALQPGAGRSAP